MGFVQACRVILNIGLSRVRSAAASIFTPKTLHIKVLDTVVLSTVSTLTKFFGTFIPKLNEVYAKTLINLYKDPKYRPFIEERLKSAVIGGKGKTPERVKALMQVIDRSLKYGNDPKVVYKWLSKYDADDVFNSLFLLYYVADGLYIWYKNSKAQLYTLAYVVALAANKHFVDLTDTKVRKFIEEGSAISKIPEPAFIVMIALLGSAGETPRDIATHIHAYDVFNNMSDEAVRLAASNIHKIARSGAFKGYLRKHDITEATLIQLSKRLAGEEKDDKIVVSMDKVMRDAEAEVNKFTAPLTAGEQFLAQQFADTGREIEDTKYPDMSDLFSYGNGSSTQSGEYFDNDKPFLATVGEDARTRDIMAYERVKTAREEFESVRRKLGLSHDDFVNLITIIRKFDLGLL